MPALADPARRIGARGWTPGAGAARSRAVPGSCAIAALRRAGGAWRATAPREVRKQSERNEDMRGTNPMIDISGARLARFAALAAGLAGAGALGVALFAAAPASAAADCVTFAGFRHCPVGAATLALGPLGDRLAVRNPDARADAGVSIELPDVGRWTGTMKPLFAAGTTDVLRASSLSDGISTSRSEVKQTADGFTFAASFTGSVEQRTYAVQVYRDGVFQGGAANIPSGTVGVTVSGIILVMGDDGIEFAVRQSGACDWGFRFQGDETVVLRGDVQLVGDEIRLVEEVNPSGGYPYTTFDGLVFQGNFSRADLLEETVR
jgi:hypothetical protein